MSPSLWQIIVVLLLVVLLFGRGRISEMMGDLGKGITSFRKGLKDADAEKKEAANSALEDKSGETVDVSPNSKSKTTQG